MKRQLFASSLRLNRNIILAVGAAQIALATPAAAVYFQQTNLVTDDQSVLTGLGFSPASFVDPNLINPWGVSFAPTGPFWVSNQGTATSTLYNGDGSPVPLVVTIPQNATGPAGPTGQIFSGNGAFDLPNGDPGLFFFANLDGSISGWNPTAGTNAQQVISPSGEGRQAIYTGLASGNVGSDSFLYAANNLTGAIDVFNTAFESQALTGNFVDPGPNPDGLAPFNVQNIGGKLYVTYAVPGPAADEADLGSGFVSEFNTDGTFVRRLTEGGPLASPWGLAEAPEGYGPFGGALLVGNFNEEHGTINAFSLTDGGFLGALTDINGDPITIPDLWGLTFGNGGQGGSPEILYFAAGIGDEEHGLFGSLSEVPEPAQWAMLLAGFGLVGYEIRRQKRRPRQFA